MYKLVALFTKPEDVEAFDKHYNEIHAPLMRKVPGLIDLKVCKNIRAFTPDAPYYLIADMIFADKDSFKIAMQSDENKAVGKDVMGFAGKFVTMVHGEFE